jgi:hypothetical protein
MRTVMMWMLVALAGCELASDGTTVQAVAGPGGVTVTVRDVGQLAVSWTADPLAVRYRVFEGGALVASVFDSQGGAPATSWIADGLDAGEHCYTVSSGYADGSTSSPGAAACAIAAGASVHTIVVPVVPPTLDPPRIALWSTISGQGSSSRWEYVPLALPVGAAIIGARVRVQDGGSGTRLVERLLSTTDNSENFSTVASSQLSSGNGTEETLELTGPIQVAPATQYIISVELAANPANRDSRLYRLEVDVR